MKLKLILIILVCLMLAGYVSAMPPPTGGFDYVEDESAIAFVAAIGYSDAVQTNFGLAIPLSTKIYTFVDFMSGDYGSALTGKLGYLLSINGGTYFGLLAGPEAQWENIPEDGVDPVLYIAGATGFVFGHSWQSFGIFGTAQRVYPLEDNQLESEYKFTAGFHLNL